MKIYEVHYDNMEPYEDNFHCSECLCSTYERAVKYLEVEKGLIKNGSNWVAPKYVCRMNNIDCKDCPLYYYSDNYNGQKFTDEDGTETDECPDLYERLNSAYYHPIWYIVEHRVLD